MSDLIEKLRNDFQSEDYRHSYAEECLNTSIATQIKVLREQRKMTQGKLAESTGMKQPRLSVLEDANYSSWSINTLKRLARAFDLALSVKFEAFSDVILDFEGLSREALERPSFGNDPIFQSSKVVRFRKPRRQRQEVSDVERRAALGQTHLFHGQIKQWPALESTEQRGVSGIAEGSQDGQEAAVFPAQEGESIYADCVSTVG